jgi:hypothetical protein
MLGVIYDLFHLYIYNNLILVYVVARVAVVIVSTEPERALLI